MLYVLIDSKTKVVKGICEQNTAQIETGMELVILQGTMEDLPSYGYDNTISFHKLINNQFVKDTLKIDQLKQEVDTKKAIKQSTINKFKALNLTEDEISLFIN